MSKKLWMSLMFVLLATFSQVSFAQIKIAFLDVLSGPFAIPGMTALRHFQLKAEEINKAGGIAGQKIEIVSFDNKGSPQESTSLLKTVIDRNIRYVAQGGGSAVALALSDAISKHNERNPTQSILYLGYAAQDPALTNERCSFWHFRFDASVDMKLEALTTQMAKRPQIKRVYILGQNYSHGIQFSKYAKEYLKRKRPDIEIVGDELHPLGQVKDFAPYVAKIAFSKADVVMTGNWGSDMALLVRAAKETGLTSQFWTIFGYGPGNVSAMGESAAGRVKTASIWHHNANTPKLRQTMKDFRVRNNDEYDFYFPQIWLMFDMLKLAADSAKSVDPLIVAYALEGLSIKSEVGDVSMRKSDHQIQVPLYVTTLDKVGMATTSGFIFDTEKSGLGTREDARFDAYVASTPTSCAMTRPAKP